MRGTLVHAGGTKEAAGFRPAATTTLTEGPLPRPLPARPAPLPSARIAGRRSGNRRHACGGVVLWRRRLRAVGVGAPVCSSTLTGEAPPQSSTVSSQPAIVPVTHVDRRVDPPA